MELQHSTHSTQTTRGPARGRVTNVVPEREREREGETETETERQRERERERQQHQVSIIPFAVQRSSGYVIITNSIDWFLSLYNFS